MEMTLGYLRESLSNYLEENEVCERLYQRLEKNNYKNEGEFVRDLTLQEIEVLNSIMKKEIDYAKQEQDDKRARELNEVYELLF
ncbi:hypothetical protein J2S74_002036 [Evansella vedderi]|uniref:Sporulation protein n=1 Tax=Evansella vedderi TaxID=38282 RepID=A0ABT9ZTT8_9BACI|nr:sigma-G-dependent sporulation-specific acid-soluble spore protein CsgA [Evansella vedderi]MDQ0254657.1 hypothetical protein [Evansella vedderi]